MMHLTTTRPSTDALDDATWPEASESYDFRRAAQIERLRREHDQALSDFESVVLRAPGESSSGKPRKLTFDEVADLTVSLRDEAAKLPDSPRGKKALAFFTDFVVRDDAARRTWEGFAPKLEAALAAFLRAAHEKARVDAACAAGTLDPKAARELAAQRDVATLALNYHDTAARALALPTMPRPGLTSPGCMSFAIVQTEELAGFCASHPPVFDDEAESRPEIDVVAIAFRQANECEDPAIAHAWLLAEVRCLAKTAKPVKAAIEQLFALRHRVYSERVRHGGMARR